MAPLVIHPVMLVAVTDVYQKRLFLESVRRALASEAQPFEETQVDVPPLRLEELRDRCASQSLWGGSRLVVANFLKELASDQEEAIEELIRRPVPGAVLVCVLPKVDQRRKSPKAWQSAGLLQRLTTPTIRDLPAWTHRMAKDLGVQMDAQAVDVLVQTPGLDLSRLELTLKQLRDFTHPKTRVTLDDVYALLLYAPTPQSVFQVLDALFEGNTAKSLSGLAQLFASGQAALPFLALMIRHVLLLERCQAWRAHRGQQGDLASFLGVPAFTVGTYERQATRWPMSKVQIALKVLVRLDRELKGGTPLSGPIIMAQAVRHLTQLK